MSTGPSKAAPRAQAKPANQVSTDRLAVAGRLAEARREAGYDSASAAAEAMGVKTSTYVHHENGTAGLARTATRYAAFYRVNLDWLLTGRGPKKAGRRFDSNASVNLPSDDDDQPIRERLRDALAARSVDPEAISRKIGRGKNYVTNFLDGLHTISAGELAGVERAMGLHAGALLGVVNEPFDQAYAADAIAGAMDAAIELSHAGFDPQLLKLEFAVPVAKSIAALLCEDAADIGDNLLADNARTQARLVARAVWRSRSQPPSP